MPNIRLIYRIFVKNPILGYPPNSDNFSYSVLAEYLVVIFCTETLFRSDSNYVAESDVGHYYVVSSVSM